MSPDPEQGMFRYEPMLLPNNDAEPNLEICFSFDTTGSMSGYINQVKEKVEHITRQLIGDLPNIRISIIAHGDYCDYHYYVLKRLDLSNDAMAISEFIEQVNGTGGGDGDECYELVLHEAQKLKWSPTSAKALVVIGDAAPHKPNEYRNIDWQVELNKLKALNVRVYGIRCGNGDKFYETIAEETGGATLELKDIQGVSELMMGLCYREAAEKHALEREDAGENPQLMDAEVMNMPEHMNVDEETALKIHIAIHNGEDTVKINGVDHPIGFGRAGCRFVKVGDETYIEQNKDKSSKYAKMAVEGRKITWIIRKGKWGLIMDDNKKIQQTDEKDKWVNGV